MTLALALVAACQAPKSLPTDPEGRINGTIGNATIQAGGRTFKLTSGDGRPLGDVVVQVGLQTFRVIGGTLQLPASVLDAVNANHGTFRVFVSGYVPQVVSLSGSTDLVLRPLTVLATEQFRPGSPTRLANVAQGLSIALPSNLVASGGAAVGLGVYSTAGGSGTAAAAGAPGGLGLMLTVNGAIQSTTLGASYDLKAWLHGWDGVSAPPPWSAPGADPAVWTPEAIQQAQAAATMLATIAAHAKLPADQNKAWRDDLLAKGIVYDDAHGLLSFQVPIDAGSPTALDGVVRTDVAGFQQLGVSMEVTVVSAATGRLPDGALPPGMPGTPVLAGAVSQTNLGNVATVISNQGANVISNNGSALGPANASGIVSNNGGTLISNNGGTLVGSLAGPDALPPGVALTTGDGKYRLAGAGQGSSIGSSALQQFPWQGAPVYLVDTNDVPVSGTVATTSTGNYTLTSLPASLPNVVVEGRLGGERLLTVAPAPGATTVVAPLDSATTAVTALVLYQVSQGQASLSKINPTGYAQDVATMYRHLTQAEAVAAVTAPTVTAIAAQSSAIFAQAGYTMASTGSSAGPTQPSPAGSMSPSPLLSSLPSPSPTATSGEQSPSPTPTGSYVPVTTFNAEPGAAYVAFDQSGLAWIASTNSSGVVAMDAMGNLIRHIAMPSNGGPIVADTTGGFYVLNMALGTASYFTSGVGAVTTIQLGTDVRGLAADDRGAVWATVYGEQSLAKLQAGNLLQKTSLSLHPSGIAYNKTTSEIWVTDSLIHKASSYSLALMPSLTVQVGNSPSGIAVSAAGDVWVANSADATVTKLSKLGIVQGTFGVPTAQQIAVGPDGKVLVTDTESSLVSVLSSTGQLLGRYGTGGLGPFGLAFDPNGRAWICNNQTGNVGVFTP